jgi:hypothetical protein
VSARIRREVNAMRSGPAFSFDASGVFTTLRPGAGASEHDLAEALRDVATAVDTGQTPGSILTGVHREMAPRVGVTASVLEADAAPRALVTVRSSPIPLVDPLTADWARAMRPSARRGPFVNELGETFWIDTFILPRLVTIVAQGALPGQSTLVARVPVRGRAILGAALRLGPGSVWLPARALARDRPANEFVGVRIKGGTARITGPTATAASTMTVSGAWTLELRLTTDPPANAAPAAGPGADAAHATVALPATITVRLASTGLTSIALGDATATAYDTSVKLTRSAGIPFYDELTRSVVVPCEPSIDAFTFKTVRSALWTIGQEAAIVRSGWALPVAVTDAKALGEAAGAGSLWLELGPALSVKWPGIARDVVLPTTVLSLAPATIIVSAALATTDMRQRLALWDEVPLDEPRRSSIEVTSIRGSVVVHVSEPGTEAVLWNGRAIAHFDRPVAADGHRVAVRMPIAWLALIETAAATTAFVIGTDPAATSAPHVSFALENALIKVRPPVWLTASGQLTNGALESGTVLLRFPYRFVLPTLPDPYAANFGVQSTMDVDVGWAASAVTWGGPATAALAFVIQTGPAAPGHQQPAGGVLFGQEFASRGARIQPLRVLLDVSSNADQFGVAIPEVPGSTHVAGLSLVASARDVAVLTLPPISWEPMLTKPPVPPEPPAPPSGDVPLPPPPHDGGPALIAADVVELRPLAPIPLLTTYQRAIQSKRHFAARLPLPFGVIANLDTRRHHEGPESPFDGAVFLNRPEFTTDLTGGLQLAIKGRNGSAGDVDPTLPGFIELSNEQEYAKGVLSENIHTRFGGDFGIDSLTGVPVRRYDLSGYGASLFSEWRDPLAVGPAIIQARFDVIAGRTSHEVIQMQSHIEPPHARAVRTITIDRRLGGWILREDSGWVPTSDGHFAFEGDPRAIPPDNVPPAFPDANVHKGAVGSVVNIRNIRLAGPQFALPAGPVTPNSRIWQPVVYDADILFKESHDPRLLVGGGSSGSRVPSRNLIGWILISGPTYKTLSLDGKQTVERVRPASGADIRDLLATKGPARGPIDCELLLGGTLVEPGLRFRTSSVDATCTADGLPRLVLAVRGSPALPRDGAWSLARIGASEKAPSALAPAFPIPLVKPNLGNPGSNRWQLADPADILRLADGDTPGTRYGLVQSLGTQKVFFARPGVGNDPKPITVPKPPQLADVGALLHAAGIFPGLSEAFDFKTLNALSVINGEMGFSETFELDAKKEAMLADLGGADAIQLVIQYQDENNKPTRASISVNPIASPRWTVSLDRVAFAVRFKKQELIRMYARVNADERTAPTVENLNVHYESFLHVLQTIFTNVQQVAKFLPGGKNAGLSVNFSQGHLTVRNAFALPSLPLGAGQITDVAVIMGLEVALTPFDVAFIAGIGSSQKPFRWIVSPLAGTGVVQVGINKGGLDVLIQGGLGLGLAIDLGIASGSASVALALEINTGPSPFELRGILSGRASVDVLQGLASATVTLAAGLGIIPPKNLFTELAKIPPPNPIPSFTIGLTASVAVGIHLTVCWVADVDFDGYWQFRQDITTPSIPIPLL